MKDRYTLDHYRNAVFYGDLPKVIVYPFRGFRESLFSKQGYILKLQSEDSALFSADMRNVLPALSTVTGLPLEGCAPFLVGFLQHEYCSAKIAWLQEMGKVLDLIKENKSRVLWSAVKQIGLSALNSTVVNDAQTLWMFLHDQEETYKEHDVSFKMFDYLSMMVNPDLRSRMEEKKKNVRENASFDSMHQALLEGNFDEIERI